ncbi:ANTAR domain-containing protein [Streptomyces sp. NPDC060011]|uniref:ANTAR domain-containing protein n=1 Tax=unclassified Streptomyces TaxID=2593676 RepID=UPI003653C662
MQIPIYEEANHRMGHVLTVGQNGNRWAPAGGQTGAPVIPRGAEDALSSAVKSKAAQGQIRPLERDRGADAVMDQATGIVMALGRMRADQAQTVLTKVSQRTRIEPDRIAGLLTTWASRGELNLGIRLALEEAIRTEHRTARRTASAAE